MLSRAERADKRARNKAAWAAGQRWNSGDAAALTPAGNGTTIGGEKEKTTPANGNGGSRNNHWQTATSGSRSLSRATRVDTALPDAEGARVLRNRRAQARVAEGPDQARALAQPFAWPCRCSEPLPEFVSGSGWWGYRFVMCCRCGRDVRYG